ncbi:MAG: hypothetical protein IPJ74_26195 [Saprospiraceae bacterium]|nr:hypothetical protein [Saprospiraceae bacterium]
MEDINVKLRELNIKDFYPGFFKKLTQHPKYETDLYHALDSSFFQLGIGMLVDTVYDENDFIGYRVYIKFYPSNILDEPVGQRPIFDSLSNLIKSRGDAYKASAKEILNMIKDKL